MANATEIKFGDPGTRIAQTGHWTVLLRPRQPTMGSLVLVCRQDVKAFGDVGVDAFADLADVVRRTERMLRQVVAHERINYLMLMMVDPDVHFHVIPRYSQPRHFHGVDFVDAGWPGPPQLEPAVSLEAGAREALRLKLVEAWT